MTDTIDAGEFSSWLRATRTALGGGPDVDVPCGECVACCQASMFIAVQPDEVDARLAIGEPLLIAAPGGPPGVLVMGHDQKGCCPKMANDKCQIYQNRPRTCRQFDCRIFAAAGLHPTEKQMAGVLDRVDRWRFSYRDNQAQTQHAAVRLAAKFIRAHAALFPGGRIPNRPVDLAVLAVKVYGAFLDSDNELKDLEFIAASVMASDLVASARKFEQAS